MDLTKIISSEIKTITTKTGRTYRKKVVTIECPMCKKIYEKSHYHDRPLECKPCAAIKFDLEGRKRRYGTIGEFHGSLYRVYKHNAEKRGYEFKVSQDFLWKLFQKQNGLCKLSGLPLTLKSVFKTNPNSKGSHIDRTRLTASIDRIDSSKGYTEDNVQWIHKVINIMKGNLSDNDFIYFCKSVSNNNIQDNTEPRLLNGGNYFKSKVQRLTGEPPSNTPDTSIPQP